jgi:hypothetical protein
MGNLCQPDAEANSFHMHCIRKILSIKWQDKITNIEVLQRSELPTLTSTLHSRRLGWIGLENDK